MNSRIIAISIGLTLLSLMILGIVLFQGLSPKKISPYIFELTNPVTSLPVHVTSVRSDMMEVQSADGSLKYRVRLDADTKILQQAMPLDYEAKTGMPVRSVPLSFKDIRKGQTVIVRTANDLRKIADKEFKATEIELPPLQKSLSGTVTRLTDHAITINTAGTRTVEQARTTDYSPEELKKFEYEIMLTQSTKVVKNEFVTEPVPGLREEPVPVSSLQAGVVIQAYLSEDAGALPLQAVRIEFSSYPTPAGTLPEPGITVPPEPTIPNPSVSVQPAGL